jgi:hypothetical protein
MTNVYSILCPVSQGTAPNDLLKDGDDLVKNKIHDQKTVTINYRSLQATMSMLEFAVQ